MKEEVDSAAAFIAGLLTNHAEKDFLEFFKFQLGEELKQKYKNHWHVRNPNRGSAYRAIGVDYKNIDAIILEPLTRAFVCVRRMTEQEAKSEAYKMGKHFPQEFTLWIDPRDVSYRIGDRGSIGVIYAGTVDSGISSDEQDTSLSPSSSASRSPSLSRPCNSPPPSASSFFINQLVAYRPSCRNTAWRTRV
jgi:protein Tob/BTG